MARTTIDRFEQRKLTRAKLIDAALRLFSTSGYEHATVDDIAQAAGYSKGAYYFHFSTKDDILVELMRIWTEDRNRVLAAERGTDEDTHDGLRAVLAAFFSYQDEPRWYALLLEFWAQAVRNPEVSSRLSQAYAGWRRQLTEVFAAAANGGALRSRLSGRRRVGRAGSARRIRRAGGHRLPGWAGDDARRTGGIAPGSAGGRSRRREAPGRSLAPPVTPRVISCRPCAPSSSPRSPRGISIASADA